MLIFVFKTVLVSVVKCQKCGNFLLYELIGLSTLVVNFVIMYQGKCINRMKCLKPLGPQFPTSYVVSFFVF